MLKQIEDILTIQGIHKEAYAFRIAEPYDEGEPFKLYCQIPNLGGKEICELPFGDWELIGLSHLLTSEQKEMVVKKCHGGYETYDKSVEFAKKNMRNYCDSVDDSYQSWLEANGIEKNTVLLKLKK